MTRFCSGKDSLSICDRCGFAINYKDRKKELSGLYVCADCYDGRFQALNNPRDKAPRLYPESITRDPRRDAFVETSVVQITDLPPGKQGL